jgi:cell division protein FtsW
MASAVMKMRAKYDITLFSVIVILVMAGIICVYDSSYILGLTTHNDVFYYLKKQILWTIVGAFLMYILMRVRHQSFRGYGNALLGLSLITLALVLIPHIGVNIKGARRWFLLGPFQFQPSEFAKLALIFFLADWYSHRTTGKKQSSQSRLIYPLIFTVIVAGMIAGEPDLGTALVILTVFLAMSLVAGVKISHLVYIVAVFAVGCTIATIAYPHRQARFKAWLHPQEYSRTIGYQIDHSINAVGSGKLFGLGFPRGREKYFLPEQNTDYIFSTIAEELGFVGCIFLSGLMFIVGLRACAIAKNCPESYSSYVAAGIGALITMQALINMSVATNLIPSTGVPLPFISYGGTSMIMLMSAAGILLNISLHVETPSRNAFRKRGKNR